MGEEKKDEGAGYPIKMLLEEALEKQRNVMMDNFAQILQRIPTGGASTSRSHSGGATPFKVQVNFDIPIFDGQIDADAIDRWDYFRTPQSRPPCQGLVGNLLGARGRGRTLFFLDYTHLEFFPRCHQGTILSRGEL
jgi:hypothetical protein